MPRSNPPTKESITKLPAQDIKDELTRAIWTTFQLELITKTLESNAQAQAESKGETKHQFETINKKLDELPDKYVTKAELNDKLRPIQESMDATNGHITWGVRLIVGAVIAALLGLVLFAQRGG